MSTHQEALIQAMVLISASDGDMADNELARISQIVRFTPIFEGFDLEDDILMLF